MAELKLWSGQWEKALKEWNMRESSVAKEWIDLGKKEGKKKGKKEGKKEGKQEGRVETLQENIRTTLTSGGVLSGLSIFQTAILRPTAG